MAIPWPISKPKANGYCLWPGQSGLICSSFLNCSATDSFFDRFPIEHCPKSLVALPGFCINYFCELLHSQRASFIHSFIHSLIHSCIHSFINPWIHSFIHSFIHSLIHDFMHSFLRSDVNNYTHLVIHNPTCDFHLFLIHVHSCSFIFIDYHSPSIMFIHVLLCSEGFLSCS